jgi:hypothetical protein
MTQLQADPELTDPRRPSVRHGTVIESCRLNSGGSAYAWVSTSPGIVRRRREIHQPTGKEPTAVRHLTGAFLTLALLSGPAYAGRNWNGAMVVHADNTVIYTPASYCELPGVPTVCEELDPNGTQGLEFPQLIWLLAAFRPEMSPAVTAIQFGIDHNIPAGQESFETFGPCGPYPLELRDEGWPEWGFGNVIALGAPVYEHVFRFYYFVFYIEGPGTYFGTRTYPSTNEAKFVDDAGPAHEDLCTNFGVARWDGTGTNHCPIYVDPVGACCFCDGRCQITWPETECTDLGGVFNLGVSCDPNPCVELEGACCFHDGRCRMLNCIECADVGGEYQGDFLPCYPHDRCPQPLGACCLGDGRCVAVTADECWQQGGFWQGMDMPCDPNPCMGVDGACCFPDGSCLYEQWSLCLEQGGIFHGMFVLCDPNPCPQPSMACCLDNGDCRFETAAVCDQLNGEPQGYGTDCDPNPCPQPPQACCFPDGSCYYLTPEECLTYGGHPMGYGTDCQTEDCTHPHLGACCIYSTRSCEITTPAECDDLDGEYQGDGVPCIPSPCASTPMERTTWGRIKAAFR